MSGEVKTPQIFKHGSAWLRADFHLHTKSDSEFKYTHGSDEFLRKYVAGLKDAGIQLGIITNHNKFVKDEFKELQKKAGKEEIYLLPGIELSVKDGSNGIHTLIVFSKEWLEEDSNHTDYINAFLSGYGPGQPGNSSGLIAIIEALEKYERDFFIVFPHVEQDSGLWEELEGGRLKQLGTSELFRKRTLAFQKVRTRDLRQKVKDWLKHWYPAEVEGSDCKSIEDIGKGEKGFIKLGAFSFDAVKFALLNEKNRIDTNSGQYRHSHIKSIHFTGGTLDGKTLCFSPELNTLIGIRGSGKSSLLEALRYALDIPFGENSGDTRYKENLIGFTLGGGGKIEIDAVDRYGQSYTIRRIREEVAPKVLIDGTVQPGVSIRETVIHKPIYFGQKDLASTGEGFEKDLINKLLGSKLDEIRRRIANQKTAVIEAATPLLKIVNVQEEIDAQKNLKRNTDFRLKFYKEHNLEKKLQKRLDFDSDKRAMKKGIEIADKFISGIVNLLSDHEDDIKNFRERSSKHNQDLFDTFHIHYKEFVQVIDQLNRERIALGTKKAELRLVQDKLEAVIQGMAEEFAEIERSLNAELKDSEARNISTTEFLKLQKELKNTKLLIAELEKQKEHKNILNHTLIAEAEKLKELWCEEFRLIKTELDQIGHSSSSLSISCGCGNDEQARLDFMKEIFKGSYIHETTYRNIIEQYPDFLSVYKDGDNAKKYFGSNPQILSGLFQRSLKTLLTYQTPNKFTIMYHNKELQHHSLGQRASALILFVLNQQDNDLIIIDQPEDDLDNQTIYEDVIKLIQKMKPKVQFIFATHNPNIPVLGDAEQIHACTFTDNTVSVCSGSVDDAEIQEKIVTIMEGGREAFRRRKEIYQIWKP